MPIREATEADMVFVVSSWVDSMRHSGTDVDAEAWSRVMSEQYSRTAERPGCKVLVYWVAGVTPGVADVVGWLCFERGYKIKVRTKERGRWIRRFVEPPEPLVHYCYTKHTSREEGVQRLLWRAAEIDPAGPYRFSCRPKTLTMSRLPKAAVYDREVRRYPKETNGKHSTETKTRTNPRKAAHD